MTDLNFRTLCAELADSLEDWLSSNSIGGISLDDGTDAELIFRARTALAQLKPPSLKEQALDAHNRMMAGEETQDDWAIVRRALEQLPE